VAAPAHRVAPILKAKPRKQEPEPLEPAIALAITQANARLSERIAQERERLIIEAEDDEVILWLM
jgi:hypothetical protein